MHERHTCAMVQLAMLRDVSGAGHTPARNDQGEIITLAHLKMKEKSSPEPIGSGEILS